MSLWRKLDEKGISSDGSFVLLYDFLYAGCGSSEKSDSGAKEEKTVKSRNSRM